MQDVLAEWDGGSGITATRASWLERATGVGEAIVVRLPDRELHGLF